MVCPADDASMSRGMLPTPTEMIRHFDRFVLGQDRSKRQLAVAVYKHYLGSRCGELPEAPAIDFERQHVLLLGPTGSGKTLLIRTLADMLGVPVVLAAATSFVETGYVGDHVESLLAGLLRAAGGDVERAHRGIVFIDEIDKIKRERGSCRDISGEGVQSSLLTLLDGGGGMARRDGPRSAAIDPSKVLFVCAGAFVGLEEIARERLCEQSPSGFGFGFASGGRAAADRGKQDPRTIAPSEMSPQDLLDRIETADLVKFGMIPEFIGRFSTISALRPLGREDLMRILTDVEGSLYPRQRALYALHGIDLDFRPEALAAIADEAARLGTGARGLRRALFRAMDSVDFRLPELAAEGVTRITFTVESVRDGAEPNMQRDKDRGGEPGRVTQAKTLRAGALRPAAKRNRPPRDAGVGVGAGAEITDTTGMTIAQVRERLDTVREQLAWADTTGSARKWWLAFEEENKHRLALVLRLAEELLMRSATVTEFFLAYVYSNTQNIQANLHYLDYQRLKKRDEERRKLEREAPEPTEPSDADLDAEEEVYDDELADLADDADPEPERPDEANEGDKPEEMKREEDDPKGS